MELRKQFIQDANSLFCSELWAMLIYVSFKWVSGGKKSCVLAIKNSNSGLFNIVEWIIYVFMVIYIIDLLHILIMSCLYPFNSFSETCSEVEMLEDKMLRFILLFCNIPMVEATICFLFFKFCTFFFCRFH